MASLPSAIHTQARGLEDARARRTPVWVVFGYQLPREERGSDGERAVEQRAGGQIQSG